MEIGAVVGLAILVALVAMGAPMWVALGIGGAVALIAGYGIDPTVLFTVMYNKMHSVTLIAIPLFILAGEVLARGGGSPSLMRFLNSMMGHIPGGPAYVVIIACVLFAAMASGGQAFIAAFAPLMLPMMVGMGYSKKFSLGLMITAASIGSLIPPSISLIIYGFITETSVKDLYTAAFVPGLILAALLAITVFIYTRRGHYIQPPRASWQERRQALREAWPVMIMPLVVLVPIYLGACTATEAAAIAVFYSLFLGFVVYRKLTLRGLWEGCIRTIHVTGLLMAIIMGAFMLNMVLVYMRIPFSLGEMLAGAGFSWPALISIIIVVFLLMGTVLDPGAILIISPPILLPSLLMLGYSPVAFGIVTVIGLELAVITPPYGINLFTAAGVLGEKFDFVARSCLMFYPAIIIGLFLVALVPQISLFLPGL